jgi:hypothetical protein
LFGFPARILAIVPAYNEANSRECQRYWTR